MVARARPVSDADRVANVERDLRDHAKTLSTLVESSRSFDTRLIVLEQADRNRQLSEAVEKERDKNTAEWRTNVNSRFEKIEGGISKLLWTFAIAIVAAFAAFLIKGGLSLP